MPVETKGYNNQGHQGHSRSTTHGHGHRPKSQATPATNQKVAARTNRQKQTNMSSRDNQKINGERQEVKTAEAPEKLDVIVNEVDSVDHIEENTTQHSPEHRSEGFEENKNVQEEEEDQERQAKPKYEKGTEYKRSNITPDNFNVREFNTNVSEFLRTLDDPRYSTVDEEYPVDELVTVVDMVTASVKDYRVHAQEATVQLEDLRDAMRTIKENLHFSISRQAMDLRAEEEDISQEEKDLLAKLTKLNSDIAQANSDVTEAIRLATETQRTAVKADIIAERGRLEAQRLQDEIEQREKIEKERREEERRRMEEQKRIEEEQKRKAEEELRIKEEEWKRREALQTEKSSNAFDQMENITYDYTNESGEPEVMCILRDQSNSTRKGHVAVTVANEKEDMLTYLPNEELISNVVDLTPTNGNSDDLKGPIFVAIPYVMNRSSGQSREAVVKGLMDGEWTDLPTQDITFDPHKDTKFAQAEVRHLTTLVVMSRFKRDYVTLDPKRQHKVSSSCDHRVTFTIERNTFRSREHFMLQVQPIDSGIFQEFRTRHTQGKNLLTCSPVVHTAFEANSVEKSIMVTVSCPPNPAKAKKLALARKLKEEKMKNPVKKIAVEIPTFNDSNKPDEKDKKREEEKRRLQEASNNDEIDVMKRPTRWYMGEYGHSDDDESDRLFFMYQTNRKWKVDLHMDIKQVKVDVLSFSLDYPVEKFMILRTRTSVDAETAHSLVVGLEEYLPKRFVEAIVRQSSDNPFNVALQVTPVSKRDAVITKLKGNGFESGPAPSHVLCLREGDRLEVGFSGNIQADAETQSPDRLIYKSNIPTTAFFTVKEQNQFRQKDHENFSGLLVLTRKFTEPEKNVALSRRRRNSTHGHSGQEDDHSHHDHEIEEKEWKRERLCALQINIPKYHVEPTSVPVRAPVTIKPDQGSVDRELLLTLSRDIGDEWRRVAHYLGVHRARVQAIMRNVNIGEQSESDARYDMLLTWLKSATKSSDKFAILSSALLQSDRPDLASIVLEWSQGRRPRTGSSHSNGSKKPGSAKSYRSTNSRPVSARPAMSVH